MSSNSFTSRGDALKYDRSITTFDPTGRLLQVEYGIEATRRGGGSIVAIQCNNLGSCILVLVIREDGSSKAPTNHRQEGQETDAVATAVPGAAFHRSIPGLVQRIEDHLWFFGVGLSGDFRVLASTLRQQAVEHLIRYGECMTVREMAEGVANLQHQLTITPGARPLACTGIVIGVHPQTSIYRTDPGGGIEHCRWACAGKYEDQFSKLLEDQYENIRSMSSNDAIRTLASLYRDHCDRGGVRYSIDAWIFSPSANHRGRTHARCLFNIDSA